MVDPIILSLGAAALGTIGLIVWAEKEIAEARERAEAQRHARKEGRL